MKVGNCLNDYLNGKFVNIYSRNYHKEKIEENVQCEIFQEILHEAKESYKQDIVHEIQNNTVEDMEQNLSNIEKWIDVWKASKQVLL